MLLFDTGKKLEKAFTQEQFDALVEVLERRGDKAATREDLRETELRMQTEIEKIRSETEKIRLEIRQCRHKILHHRAIQRTCTIAKKEDPRFAYRVAIARHCLMFRNVFSMR